MLAVVWWIPEIPRYYVSKDQPEKGLQILANYQAEGDELDEVLQLDFTKITTAIPLEKNSEHFTSYVDFLRTANQDCKVACVYKAHSQKDP